MNENNCKMSYLRSIRTGGIAGLLFVIYFFASYSVFSLIRDANQPEPIIIRIYFNLQNIVSFISQPVYVIGIKLNKISLLIGPILFVLYWVAIGAIIALIVDRFYSAIFNKSKTNIVASPKK